MDEKDSPSAGDTCVPEEETPREMTRDEKKTAMRKRCLRDLLRRKADLEKTFDVMRRKGSLRVYPHAYYAYISVIKAINELGSDMPREGRELEEWRRKEEEIMKQYLEEWQI